MSASLRELHPFRIRILQQSSNLPPKNPSTTLRKLGENPSTPPPPLPTPNVPSVPLLPLLPLRRPRRRHGILRGGLNPHLTESLEEIGNAGSGRPQSGDRR